MSGLVGVAISTHRRPKVLSASLKQWAKRMPDVLVVNHDVNGDGVAATKNKGIAALMDAGVEHLFLADDDCYPLVQQWWTPYVAADSPHLMHCFVQRRYIPDQSDDTYSTWTYPNGALIYAHRSVVERVGGMRLEFGRWGGEHVEWSHRIHNAGLTPAPFQSLRACDGRDFWHCFDYDRKAHASTVDPKWRKDTKPRRHALVERFQHTDDYVPYREA